MLYQLVGVFADKLTEPLAVVLGDLGARDIMVVHGEDGLDEITISNGTRVSRFREGRIETFYIAPEDFGLGRADVESLHGGDKDENRRILRSILDGERGPKRDVVLMNAAAALVVAGKTEDLRDGALIASGVIDSGDARRKLEEIVRVSHAL